MALLSPSRQSAIRPMYFILALLGLTLTLMACKPERAQGSPQLDSAPQLMTESPQLPKDPAIQVAYFENGVTFISRSVAATHKGAALALVVRVGSLAEQPDERGLAHLVEHLAVNGTLHSSRPDLALLEKDLGLTLGADANATTALTVTSYLLEVTGSDASVLDRAVAVLSDWATELRVDAASLTLARSEVLAEMRAGQDGSAALQRRLMEHWLAGSPYANRDPIGVEAVLEGATPERITSFHRRWYQPQNLTVVANGDFDVEAMRRRVERHFAALPRPEHPEALAHFELPITRGHQLVAIESEPDLPGDMVEVGLKRAASGLRTEADYQRGILDSLLAYLARRRVAALPARPSSALNMAEVVLQWGDRGMFDALHFQARAAGAPDTALAALLTELERISRHGFTPDELELARAALTRDWAGEWSRRSKLRQQALDIARRTVVGDAIPSWEQEDELRTRQLRAITLEHLNRHAQHWAQESERLLLVIARGRLPNQASLREAAARVAQEPVAPYAGDLDVPLMSAAPAPGTVVSTGRIDAIDTHIWTLANGARVLFKPLAWERGRLSFAAASPGGTYRWQKRELANGLVAAGVVTRLGLGTHDAPTTRRLLYESGVQVVPWISDYREGVYGSAYVASLEQLFQTLHLTLSQPGRDPAAFDAQRQLLRENLLARHTNPTTAFDDAITRQLWNGHPRYSILPPEAADVMDRELMRALYLDRFGDVGDFTFAFVGDTTSAQIEPLVQRYIASLPGTGRADGAPRADVRYRPGVTRVHLEQGAQAQAIVSVRFHGDEALPPAAEGELKALRAYLELRLREELRERLGGVYALDVSYQLRQQPRQGHELGFRFECRPEQRQQLERAAFDVIDSLRNQGIQAAQVETLKRQIETSRQYAERTATFWQEHLLAAYLDGRNPEQALTEATSLEHITSGSLRAAARRYLRNDQYVEAVLLPAPAPAAQR